MTPLVVHATPGEPPVHLNDGDVLTVTPRSSHASVRADGPFVVMTPGTEEELRELRRGAASVEALREQVRRLRRGLLVMALVAVLIVWALSAAFEFGGLG